MAASRVALVIGNANYAAAPVLRNPANDARDLATALRGTGFNVTELHDATRSGMIDALRDFANKIAPDDIVLFYYAGHGMQITGENYLVPVDAKVINLADARFNTLSLPDIVRTIEGRGRANIFILDSCRDNPFPSVNASSRGNLSRGFNRMETTVAGTLLVYATQPDNVADDGQGRNSPFATALLKYIAVPGLEIRKMLTQVRADVIDTSQGRQIPWDNSSLTSDVYLGPPASAAPDIRPASPPAVRPDIVVDAGTTELLYWQSVAKADKKEFYQYYLHQYCPNGQFCDIARQRIIDLDRPVASRSATEPELKLIAPQNKPNLPPMPKPDVFLAEGPFVTSSYWSHNGSIVGMAKSGDRRRIRYENPKVSLSILNIHPGTLLFDGHIKGSIYTGQAYTFVKDCASIGFSVEGTLSADEREITMVGQRPIRNLQCHIESYERQTLTFTFEKSATH